MFSMLLFALSFVIGINGDSSRLLQATGCELVRCAACTECREKGNSGAACVDVAGCCSSADDCGDGQYCEGMECKDYCFTTLEYNPYCCGTTQYSNPSTAACAGIDVTKRKSKCNQGECCGGFAGTACPDATQICVDDPFDSCDPDNGGADCTGSCQFP
eukprot:22604_1